MPGPDRSERVHKRNIFPEVGEEPQSRRNNEVSDAEQDDSEDGHGEETGKQPQEGPTKVVYTEAHFQRPEGVADNYEDGDESEDSVDLAHDLAALVQPSIIHVVAGVLLADDFDGPKTLDALCLLRLLSSVGVNLLDSKGQHRHGQ